MSFFKHRRKLALILIDLAALFSVYAFSFIIDKGASPLSYAIGFGISAVFIFLVRIICRIYSNVWRYANSRAYLEMVFCDALGGGVGLIVNYFLLEEYFFGIWQTIALVTMFCCLTLALRFLYQQKYQTASLKLGSEIDHKILVAIVGAGQVGALLAEELLCYKGSHYRPVCFFDNNSVKIGSRLRGLPVYSEDGKIEDVLVKHRVQEIFVAIPQLSGEDAKRVFEHYGKTGLKVKLYDFPRHDETEGADSSKRVIREFKIEDLLFRSAIQVTDGETATFYENKVVLVTGGGGSIGSELSRQIAKCNPKRLVIFDIYENNAYDIQQELIRKYGSSLNLSVEIGSVRDRARLNAVFAAYRPDIVFHAAAHKHVPLMEHSNCEAIKNNCVGTYNTADMAEKYGVKKFILVSTDKAVNPTNVMGASKRMCEMIVQCRTDSDTVFSAVRFGNVLGSNGSVIPLFKRQISSGGPITITDKRIIRYFMTIPEASGLVMQAGAMAKRGDLFVLDMGKPIKIYDLAENMIKLSGLRPHVDIPIVETGLRPGEKLYEELLIKTEDLIKTDNNLIFIEHDRPLSRFEVDEKLNLLREAVERAENEIGAVSITEAIKTAVPTFLSPEEVNARAQEAEEMKLVTTK